MQSRWSAFEKLEKKIHKELEKLHSADTLPQLKKGQDGVGSGITNIKTWINPLDQALVEDRRVAVQAYIRDLCSRTGASSHRVQCVDVHGTTETALLMQRF